MCGIAGIFERDTDNTQLMSEMLATIEHRGPDDQSIYTYQDFLSDTGVCPLSTSPRVAINPFLMKTRVSVSFLTERYTTTKKSGKNSNPRDTYFIPLPTRKFWFIFTRSTEPGSSTIKRYFRFCPTGSKQ